MPDGPNEFDKFDEAPAPAPTGPTPQTVVDRGRPMSSVGDLPQPTEQEQQSSAREAREAAGRTPRQRATPEYAWMSTPPAATSTKEPGANANPYDKFDNGPEDDGVALMERLRLNRQDAFYRGSVAGSSRLAALAHIYQTPDGPDVDPARKKVNQEMRDEYVKVVSDLAAHDNLQGWETTLEAGAALAGQLEGTLISPESWIGWGAKGVNWGLRTVNAGLQQAAIQLATDPVVQKMNVESGVQNEVDWERAAASAAPGFLFGAGGHAVSESLGHVIGDGLAKFIGQRALRKQLYDLAGLDPAFDAPQMAMWALDPRNGIQMPQPRGPVVEAPKVPEDRYGVGPEHGFADTVTAEKERLSASAGAAQPRAKRLNDDAKFSAFQKEVGPQVEAVLSEHGFTPDQAQELYKHYDREPGEHPNAALERSIQKWYAAEERAAMSDAMLDEEFSRELRVLQEHFENELDKPLSPMRHTDFRGRETDFPGESPRVPRARADESPPFESGLPAREGGTVPEGGAPQPGEARAAAEGGEARPTGGERGGERIAAEGPRGERVTDRKPLLDERRKLLEERRAFVTKGDLTRAEATIFRDKGRRLAELDYQLALPGDPTKVAPTDQSKSALAPETVVAAYDDTLRNQPVFMALREAADGVEFNADTAIDRIMSGKNEEITARQFYDTFAATREALRKQFGDTLTLYRSEGRQKAKATQNWATTREFAEQFGDNIKVAEVPVEDVVGAFVNRTGKYHEIIVGTPPERSLATERTVQGDQTLIPGVEPITDKQRAEAGTAKPMRGGDAPAGGLFDEGARAQTDLFLAQRQKGGTHTGEPTRQPVAAPVEPPSPAEDNAVRSLQQQAMDLAKALDFPLREGRVTSRDAAGVYKSSGVVRVREVPDFDVVAHEGGHALEAKVGKELTDLTKSHAGELRLLDYDQGPTGKRVNEGFAEYVRLMMTNPAYAEKAAPLFDNEFRAFMQAKQPEMLQKLDAAAVAYKAYLEAPSMDAVGAVRRSVDEEPGAWGKTMEVLKEEGLPGVVKGVMQKSYDAVLDDKAPVARAVRDLGVAIRARTGKAVTLLPSDDPERLFRLATRSRQTATRDMMDGVRPYHELAPEGPSLANAISEAMGSDSVWGRWDPVKKADFSSYLIARRAEFLWRKFEAGDIPNPPTSFSKGDAVQAMADFERLNPNFRNASQMVHDYNRQLLRKAYEGGLISADLHEKITQDEFYVPFNRDMSDKPGAGVGGGGAEGPGTTQVVRRLRGSSRDIKDPLESIMTQTFLINRTLAHNDVVKAFVRLAERAGPEGGKFVEVIPAQEARKYTFDLEQAIENRAKEVGMDPDDAKNLIAALGDPEGGDIKGSYFKMEQAAARGEPIVFYRDGGVLKAARFMSEKEGHALYELMTAAPEPIRDIWSALISGAAALKRSSIVTNPTFALTNYIRDQMAAGILRSDYIPIYSGIRGIADEFRQANNAVLYGYAGGVAGGASVGPVEHAAERGIDALKRQGYAVQRFGPMRDVAADLLTADVKALPKDAKEAFLQLMELASFTEAGTRNSIFGTVFESSKRKGLSDYDAMVEAAFQAQDMLDFSRHGSRTIAIRNFLPFFNAHLQGLDKARRTMIEPITNRLRQGQVFERDSPEFNNALAAWVKAGAAGGALGVAWAALMSDHEAYRDASPYFKGTHLVIPWGNKIIVMPKPFELGMGFTMGEYAYHAMAEKDPRAARMLAESVWDTISPPNPISDFPIVTPTIELMLGKSLFTGRDIVPEQVQKLPAGQQYTDRTSELAKYLGKQLNISPIKIDYAVGSQFATWGRDVMAMSQGVNENAPAASLDDMVFFRRFVKDPTRSSDVTTRFWDYMGRTTGKFNQDVAGYDDLVRDASRAGQPLTAATEFLAKLPAAERSFVTLKSAARENGKPAFSADERRLHPLQHAYDAVTVLNNLRRELSENQQTAWGTKDKIALDPQQRRLLLENVRELAQMEMRNSLVLMGEGGFAGRPVLDPNDTMDKIRHLSPATADEIAARYATAKIYNFDSVRRAWPQLRDETVRNGSDADIRGLAFDAKADGYQFNGERAKRPGVTRQRIAPQSAPAPQP